uniref:Uncharacterized protein n=1 Tax=Aegilops tauschii subsp. strangulata TaxID=200361 RepID=A0A453TD48_AEGTS
MAAVSATIFAGTLLSAVVEIRDTRWSWRGRSRTTPLRWLLCFPPGVEMEAGTATQAAADAAVAAAHAAVAVVRLPTRAAPPMPASTADRRSRRSGSRRHSEASW